tara:strand:- start:3662 stop:4453 length:792 start_codon:yes stop_codon:yes gene_type:complete
MLYKKINKINENYNLIDFNSVSGGYNGELTLNDINLTIQRGDFIGLLGPSGSGKTTLLKAMLGDINLYSGSIKITGSSPHKHKLTIGYVPQLETIDWNFPVTVRQVISMGAIRGSKLYPWISKKDKLAVEAVSIRLGLDELINRQIRELSGGQQQRTFLARALVSNPDILMLDEPTSRVDIKTKEDIMTILKSLNHLGVTIIMTTHEINSIATHLPRVICMKNIIIADGSPDEIFTEETFYKTYGAEIRTIEHEGSKFVIEML